VTAPAQLAQTRAEAMLWEIEAKDSVSGARDALKAQPALIPAVPLTVQQATLVQMEAQLQPARGAARRRLPGRGGLKLRCSPSWPKACPACATGLPATPLPAWSKRPARPWACATASCGRAWWRNCPPTSMPTAWPATSRRARATARAAATSSRPTCWPPRGRQLNPAFALPDEVRAPMERGLIAFVEGRIQRNFWSPRKDLDVRKLAAIEALSRYGKAQGRMLSSITIAPNQWPTSAVIDWVNILKRVADVPQREQRWPRPRRSCVAPELPGHQSSSSAPSRATTGGG
jgi:hypothetical protein